MDVHATSIAVGRMIDGAKPHIPERILGIFETAFTGQKRRIRFKLHPGTGSLSGS